MDVGAGQRPSAIAGPTPTPDANSTWQMGLQKSGVPDVDQAQIEVMHTDNAIASARAAAGAAFLDAAYPGWHETVNVAVVDIGSYTTCMLAQASQMDYRAALRLYRMSRTEAILLGFARDWTIDPSPSWGDLESAWAAEVWRRCFASTASQ